MLSAKAFADQALLRVAKVEKYAHRHAVRTAGRGDESSTYLTLQSAFAASWSQRPGLQVRIAVPFHRLDLRLFFKLGPVHTGSPR